MPSLSSGSSSISRANKVTHDSTLSYFDTPLAFLTPSLPYPSPLPPLSSSRSGSQTRGHTNAWISVCKGRIKNRGYLFRPWCWMQSKHTRARLPFKLFCLLLQKLWAVYGEPLKCGKTLSLMSFERKIGMFNVLQLIVECLKTHKEIRARNMRLIQYATKCFSVSLPF